MHSFTCSTGEGAHVIWMDGDQKYIFTQPDSVSEKKKTSKRWNKNHVWQSEKQNKVSQNLRKHPNSKKPK